MHQAGRFWGPAPTTRCLATLSNPQGIADSSPLVSVAGFTGSTGEKWTLVEAGCYGRTPIAGALTMVPFSEDQATFRQCNPAKWVVRGGAGTRRMMDADSRIVIPGGGYCLDLMLPSNWTHDGVPTSGDNNLEFYFYIRACGLCDFEPVRGRLTWWSDLFTTLTGDAPSLTVVPAGARTLQVSDLPSAASLRFIIGQSIIIGTATPNPGTLLPSVIDVPDADLIDVDAAAAPANAFFRWGIE